MTVSPLLILAVACVVSVGTLASSSCSASATDDHPSCPDQEHLILLQSPTPSTPRVKQNVTPGAAAASADTTSNSTDQIHTEEYEHSEHADLDNFDYDYVDGNQAPIGTSSLSETEANTHDKEHRRDPGKRTEHDENHIQTNSMLENPKKGGKDKHGDSSMRRYQSEGDTYDADYNGKDGENAESDHRPAHTIMLLIAVSVGLTVFIAAFVSILCNQPCFHGPWRQLLVGCLVLFADQFNATQTLAYMPWVCTGLRGTGSSNGLFTGLFYAMQCLGVLVSMQTWARITDQCGRRTALLATLALNFCVTVGLMFCGNYPILLVLAFLSGLFNTCLPALRTHLLEVYDRARVDETHAFAMLSVTCGAATICGPAIGGILYARVDHGTIIKPWALPMCVAAALYLSSLIIAGVFLEEVRDGDTSPERKATGPLTPSAKNAHLIDRPYTLLMIMAGGVSYVCTGWELAYPLFARLPVVQGGFGWSTSRIGVSFLVGSLGLMFFSLFFLTRLIDRFCLLDVWHLSTIVPMFAICCFPRFVCFFVEQPYGLHMRFLNYFVQIIVNAFIGGLFVLSQLLLNNHVLKRADQRIVFPMVNGFTWSLQLLVRCVAPLATGVLFDIGFASDRSGMLFNPRFLAFDHLAVVGLVCCFVCGFMLPSSRGDSITSASQREVIRTRAWSRGQFPLS